MAEVRTARGVAADGESSIGTWVDQHAGIMLVSTLVTGAVGRIEPIVLACAASLFVLASRARPVIARLRPYGGAANRLTALRIALVLAAAVALEVVPALVFALAFAANVILDAVDGRIARRRNETSELGTVFDREADAIAVLIAYVYFFVEHDIGAWILVPGLLPYGYRLLTVHVLDAPDSERRQAHAAVLAGLNYLILLAALVAPPSWRFELLALSTAVVLLSFLISFGMRYRNEHQLS